MSTYRLALSGVSMLLVGLGHVAVAGAVDLNGTWRVEATGIEATQLVEITQTGSDVSFSFDIGSGVQLDFAGTASAGSVSLTISGGVPCPGSGEFEILPGDGVMDGRFVLFHPTNCNPPGIFRLLATRCGCDDGNAVDGDGCDARCQVEPCFACSGTPSVCTPLADGAACDDRRDCTGGTTCSGGVCGAGTALPACIDLTGRWRITAHNSPIGPITSESDAHQRDGIVTFRGPYDRPEQVGTIDGTTGALDLRAPATGYFCTDPATTVGTASADGLSFTGGGNVPFETVRGCAQYFSAYTGARCDGEGVECTEPCTPESCGPCGTCHETLGCVAAPRTDCRASLAPTKSKLDVRDGEPSLRDSLGWTWSKGAATTRTELGDPTASSDVALCVFDPVVGVLLQARVPAGGLCGGKPCWRADAKGFRYTDAAGSAGGITKLQLVAGTAGKAKALVRGKGAELDVPSPPYALPVRVQLQVEGGACFESVHGPAGVRRNDGDVFKATGTP